MIVVTRKRRLQVLDLGAQFLAHLGVERRQRLVEQQHRRLGRERARERNALLLSAGQLMRIFLRLVAQVHERQHFVDPSPDRVLRPFPAFEPIADVPGHRHVGKQRIRLEDDAEIAQARRDADEACTVLRHFAGIGRLEAGDDPQQRGLAAARRTEKADEFAFVDVQADVVQRQDAAEPLGDVAQRQKHGGSSWVASAAGRRPLHPAEFSAGGGGRAGVRRIR